MYYILIYAEQLSHNISSFLFAVSRHFNSMCLAASSLMVNIYKVLFTDRPTVWHYAVFKILEPHSLHFKQLIIPVTLQFNLKFK
jgi:hypothetical protein